jgi:PAS domain-containing protein
MDAELLSESVWNPLDMSPLPKHFDLASHSNIDGYSQFELDRLYHALNLLACFGVRLDHRPKIELYAQAVAHKGVISCANDEFCALVRGSRTAIVGRSLRDFTPRALEQWHEFMLDREMFASGKSSVMFESLFARVDGSVFRCYMSVHVFSDVSGVLCETLLSIQLSTVVDLDIPRSGSLACTSPRLYSE